MLELKNKTEELSSVFSAVWQETAVSRKVFSHFHSRGLKWFLEMNGVFSSRCDLWLFMWRAVVICSFVLEHSSPCRSWTGLFFWLFSSDGAISPPSSLLAVTEPRLLPREVFWQEHRARLAVLTPKLALNFQSFSSVVCSGGRGEVEEVITPCRLHRDRSGGCKCLWGSWITYYETGNRNVETQDVFTVKVYFCITVELKFFI